MGHELKALLRMGELLEQHPAGLGGNSVREFMARSLLRIRGKDGGLLPLNANRAQRDFDRRAGKKNIVVKARQLGITTWIAARFFLATITHPGTLSVLVAQDQDAAEEIFRVVRRFLDLLPERMREGPLRTSRANARQIIFEELDSQYRVETAGDSSAGRGMTIQNLHCSEIARWPGEPDETLAALRAAVSPEGEIVLESTPAGASGTFYHEWQAENEYVKHFFPWWMAAEYRRKAAPRAGWSEEEEGLAEAYELDEEQIGFRRWIGGVHGARWRQEFPESAEECFLLSTQAVFDLDRIMKRLAEAGEAVETRENGRVRIYLPPAAKRAYVMGVDPSGGGAEGDYACAEIVEVESGMQCAEIHGHYPPREMARRAAALAREYNDALIAVESNNHGHAVLTTLEDMERYPRLYSDSKGLGWTTTGLTRPRMVTMVAAQLAESAEAFHSRTLLEEMRTFVRDEKGHEAAAQGAHDDTVMAMGLALAVREEEKRKGPGSRIQREFTGEGMEMR